MTFSDDERRRLFYMEFLFPRPLNNTCSWSKLSIDPDVLWFFFLGNGFIEARELDEFLEALWKEGHPGKVKRKNAHKVLSSPLCFDIAFSIAIIRN